MFLNRTDAGRQLAQALVRYRGQEVVVYALPRGGVVLGVEVAQTIGAPLDLIVVRKIGHPLQSEYAVAAVAEDGYVVSNSSESVTSDSLWFARATAAELNEARRRRRLFLEGRPSIPVIGKIAIIVDDGLATGLTMLAAIHEIRKRGPKKVIVAVPVGAADTIDVLRHEADEVVALYVPDGWFGAIGSFYQNFDQVSDEEVIALLKSTPVKAT
jgi:putative phosphoribosyl transferase